MLPLHHTLCSGIRWCRTTSAGLGASAVAAMMLLGFLVWFACSGATLRREMRLETARAVRVAELRGTISYLNEWLTMSARLAALSGQARWVDRYNEAGPRLDAAIAEALALATPEVRAELAGTTDEASHDLIRMERTSIARAAAGDHGSAIALLDSPEFAYLEATYAAGLDSFGQDLTTLAAARSTSLNNRAWTETSALALTAVLLVAAFFAMLGRARLQTALARTESVARTDTLTDLPNRRRLYEELRGALARLDRGKSGVALLLLDLDRFKTINDLHGHLVGDHLLQLVAARLRMLARAGDLVARLGGDEFALIIPFDAADPSFSPADAATLVARRVIASLHQAFELTAGVMVQVGVSVGMVLAEQAGEEADTLMHCAEVAMHQAKADGRGHFRFFEPGMDAASRARALLEGDLREALAGDQIIPNFQPMMDMNGGHVAGFEMLARWPHPTRGMVSPAVFVPIVEELGLIGLMTDRLLRRACRIATTWPQDVSLACNVSPLQLRDRGLPAMIRDALLDAGLSPNRLELEITESALVGDLDLARDILYELKALGVRLALDDFGTGYSSLRHLQMLPFDTLKIDASFVGAMVRDVESRKIVTAVVGLAKSLGLSIVAEGVEEPETAAMLREMSCDVGQGWLFGRPSSPEVASTLFLDMATT